MRGAFERLDRICWCRRLLLFGPAAIAYVGALWEPTLREALVPASLRQVMASGRTWTDIQPAMRPGMATLIFTNNIQVAFLAFAGGVLFGLGTATSWSATACCSAGCSARRSFTE